MYKDEKPGFAEKAGMYAEKITPGKSKHSLTGVSYNLEDVSPFAIDLSGAPRNKGLLALMAIIGGYIVYWFWYGWVNTGVIDLELLEYMTMIATTGGFMIALIMTATLIDLHKGSFAPYIKILELRIRSMLGKPLKRVEFKVIKYWELYNPTVGGFWRSPDEYREEADEEEKEESEFKPVDVKDDAMPFYELEGERFSSMKDMKKIMDMALIEGEVVETKDEIKDILRLKREFADLSEKIRLPFVVTMCKCDSKGGRVYPIFISNYSLFGGSTGLGSYVEFRDHTLAQRTWAGIISKENVRAGIGEGVEIGMYKFYDMVSDELLLSGKKEEKMRFAPVIFVTASDAQAERVMNDFRSNEIRESPVQQDLIDASVVYDNSIADQLFETLKLVISRLKRKEKSEEEIRKDSVFDNKEMVWQGLEMALITGKAGKPGRFSNINLFSHKSIRYLFYIIGVLGALFIAFYILHYYVGLDFGWLFNEIPEEIPEDWGDAAKIGFGWFK
ncbi:MAG: hypothetical protein E3J87_02020 [Candidatus Cloacimonadota bacterium]|nr:MAG: hypothetical protein E3J87_02020 [Candidatus Cloacimonadota bacterium]